MFAQSPPVPLKAFLLEGWVVCLQHVVLTRALPAADSWDLNCLHIPSAPAQTGSLGNSSLVFPLGAVEQHYQAGATPAGLGSEGARPGCWAAGDGEHRWVLRT